METITSYLMVHGVPNWAFGASLLLVLFFAITMLVAYVKLRNALKQEFAKFLGEKAKEVLDRLYYEIVKLPEQLDMPAEARDKLNRDLGIAHKEVVEICKSDPLVIVQKCYSVAVLSIYFNCLSKHGIRIDDELYKSIDLYTSKLVEAWEEITPSVDIKDSELVLKIIRYIGNQNFHFRALENTCFTKIKNMSELTIYVDSDQEEE